MSLSIGMFIDECGRIAKSKGWDDKPVSVAEDIALMHSELSEALEDHRNGRLLGEIWLDEKGKPCGFLTELADVMIRIGHFVSKHKLEGEFHNALEMKIEYNRTRPYRHGDKKL